MIADALLSASSADLEDITASRSRPREVPSEMTENTAVLVAVLTLAEAMASPQSVTAVRSLIQFRMSSRSVL